MLFLESHSATWLPDAAARSIRSVSVSIDRASIQEEWGSSWKPKALRVWRIGFSSAFDPVMPAIRSLCPRHIGQRIDADVDSMFDRSLGTPGPAWCCRRR